MTSWWSSGGGKESFHVGFIKTKRLQASVELMFVLIRINPGCRGKTCSPLCLVCSPMGTPWQRRWVSDDNGRQFINNAVNRTIFNLPLEVTPNCNIWEEFWGQFCDIFWLFEIYPQYLRGMINSVIYFHKVNWDIFMKFKRKTNWDQLVDISNA